MFAIKAEVSNLEAQAFAFGWQGMSDQAAAFLRGHFDG
jgi:hypothetical protein